MKGSAIGVSPERVYFELFDGTHGNIEYHYPQAIEYLTQRLVTESPR